MGHPQPHISEMTFQYVPLRWNHYIGCRNIFEEAFALSERATFPMQWRTRCEKRSVVALYRDVVVGFALVDTQYTIQYIGVHPEFQNAHLGSQLLAYVVQACADDRSIWLVTADDTRLLQWYERHGFRVTNTHYNEHNGFMGADMVRRQRCRSATTNPPTSCANSAKDALLAQEWAKGEEARAAAEWAASGKPWGTYV